MRSGEFIGGSEVMALEKELAEFCQNDYCIACARYHDALEMLLRVNGIGDDEEVILPAIGPLGMAHAVSWIGATPRFVDVSPRDLTINPEEISKAINSRTRAIVVLHLYGFPCAMEEIVEIADAHDLILIEDISHGVGGTIGSVPLGNFSHAALIRFSPGLSLGAYGEAAAVLTRDDGIARRVSMLANQGRFGNSDEVFIAGTDSRMSEINAALLRTKLHRQEMWINKRRALVQLYQTYLAGMDLEILQPRADVDPVLASVPVLTKEIGAALRFLNRKGWGAGVAMPSLLPMLRCYKTQGYRERDFPVAVESMKTLLPLPLAAEMVRLDVEEICEGVQREIASVGK